MSPATVVSSWSEAWLDALAKFSHPGRLRRGRRFAEHGRVQQFDITPGKLNARVKDGDQSYTIEIHLTPLDDKTWDAVIERLASQALYSARLLSGEIPPAVVEVFEEVGAPLFPEAEALQASCTCPDWEVPCKHIAALYYLLADQFEEDPFLLFLLRGRSKAEVLTALRHHRQISSDDGQPQEVEFTAPALAEQLHTYWDIGEEAERISFTVRPPNPPLPHLKRLGPPPFTTLDLITLLSPIYETVTEEALKWAFEEAGTAS